MAHEDLDADPTAAHETTAAPEEGPHAYALEPVEDYPSTEAAPVDVTRAGRTRWALSLAALIAAVAALVAAGMIGVRALDDTNTPVVAVTRPTITTRAPALTTPDPDSLFLQDLDGHGVWSLTAYGAVHDGHLVCNAIHIGGGSRDDIAHGLIISHIAGTGMTDRAAADKFIDIAIAHYCPDVKA